jgi:ubiquinone/menaquinone biosynthesis C-methylase UbiE
MASHFHPIFTTMEIKSAYNEWAAQYDTNLNKTRDLESAAIRQMLSSISFKNCLEIGCGTGKNTSFLSEKGHTITAVDFSEAMLTLAKAKIQSPKVNFIQADITKAWDFETILYDLISFSLVLEHIENIDAIFEKASHTLCAGGYIYVGEFHPFKQYTGSKARFETPAGTTIVTCYTHHISEFTDAAKKHHLQLIDVQEFFDNDDKNEIPRVLGLLFKKK